MSGVSVVLGGEAGQDLLRRRLPYPLQRVSLHPLQPPVSDQEHGGHPLAPVDRQPHDVHVRTQPRAAYLFVGQLLDRLEPVPERRRPLEVQFLAGSVHLGPEPLGHCAHLALHERRRVIQEGGVGTGFDQPRAGAGTDPQVVVETYPSPPKDGIGASAKREDGPELSHRTA